MLRVPLKICACDTWKITFLKINVVNNSHAQIFRGEVYKYLQPTLKKDGLIQG